MKSELQQRKELYLKTLQDQIKYKSHQQKTSNYFKSQEQQKGFSNSLNLFSNYTYTDLLNNSKGNTINEDTLNTREALGKLEEVLNSNDANELIDFYTSKGDFSSLEALNLHWTELKRNLLTYFKNGNGTKSSLFNFIKNFLGEKTRFLRNNDNNEEEYEEESENENIDSDVKDVENESVKKDVIKDISHRLAEIFLIDPDNELLKYANKKSLKKLNKFNRNNKNDYSDGLINDKYLSNLLKSKQQKNDIEELKNVYDELTNELNRNENFSGIEAKNDDEDEFTGNGLQRMSRNAKINKRNKIFIGRGFEAPTRLTSENNKHIYLDLKKLNMNILTVKYYSSNRYVIKPTKISDNAKIVINEIIANKAINPFTFEKLNKSEMLLIENFIQEFKIEGIQDFQYKNIKELYQQYDTLRGQISIGNNSPEIKRGLVDVVDELLKLGKINQNQKKQILEQYH